MGNSSQTSGGVSNFQQLHAAWAMKTFPEETLEEVLDHLRVEINEAQDAPLDVIEWADCYMLLQYACYRSGHSMSEVRAAAREKHQINLKRNWPGKNEKGIYQHG